MSRWPVRISQTGGGPTPPVTSQDRFAPKYLVGNTDYGDSAVAYNTAGFRYIPDTGNGAGIALALSAAAANPGDVWIRPGTYDFGKPGAPSTPLVIPPGCRVQGSGFGAINGTVLQAKSAASDTQAVFRISDLSQLHNLVIIVPESEGAGVDDYIVRVEGIGATIANIGIVASMTTDTPSALRYLLRINPVNSGPPIALENVLLNNSSKASDTPSDSALLLVQTGNVTARNITTSGGGRGIEVANAAVLSGGNRQCSLRADDVYIDLCVQRGIYYHEVAPENQAPGEVKVHRAKIEDFAVEQPGCVGVLLDSGEGHTLSDCVIDMASVSGSVGVAVTSTSGSCTDVVVTGCKIESSATGILFQPTGENVVTRCSVTDCEVSVAGALFDRAGIYIYGSTEITVTSSKISAQGQALGFATRAVYVRNSSDVVIGENVIKTFSAQSTAAAAIDLGDSGQPPAGTSVQRVTVSSNDIITSERYAVRAQGGTSKWLVVSDNNIRTFVDNANFRPVGAVYTTIDRSSVTGNVINHCADDQIAATGVAIIAIGDRATVASNTIEMNIASNDPAISVQGAQTSCTGNSIGLTGQYPTAAILLNATSVDCTCVSNTCGTVPPVDDQGTTNEVAHNT
jgi:hypothetical protein